MALDAFYTVLQDAASKSLMVMIDYESPRDGKYTVGRTVEPYKYDGTFFWGFDVLAGSIKKFYASGITNLVETQTPFVPRWPIEIF
jgi:hypothetical protein